MHDFRGKVALITGAGSGIGRALADRFAHEGMKLVLVDIEESPLSLAANELRERGNSVHEVCADVSLIGDVEEVSRQAIRSFGAVDILCNNAGVGGSGGVSWAQPANDWEWVLGVNLWGVINAVRVFVPLMLNQNTPGHIVNTASLVGVATSEALMAPYAVSKHAVVALSESLQAELRMANSAIRVSVLCPGFVNTKISDSSRSRPSRFGDDATDTQSRLSMRAAVAQGVSPSVVADRVIEGIRNECFYVFVGEEWRVAVRGRLAAMLRDQRPER